MARCHLHNGVTVRYHSCPIVLCLLTHSRVSRYRDISCSSHWDLGRFDSPHRYPVDVPDFSPFLPVRRNLQASKTNPTQACYFRAGSSLLSIHLPTLVPGSTPCSYPPCRHPLRIDETAMANFVLSACRDMINRYAAFSHLPSQPLQAKIVIINGKLRCIRFGDMHLRSYSCPTITRSLSEGDTPYGVQRCLSFSWRQDFRLIRVHRPRRCFQEPSTSPLVSPLTFMDPQTGPKPPANLAPEPRRRRGLRSQYFLPPPEDAPQIRCGWTGCGVQLAYNQRAISCHVNGVHKERSLPLICQWEKSGGGICGASMQPNHLRRHTLDIHTGLMIARCEWCGEAQRKDVMSRHKKSCERRRNRLPK